MEAMPKNPRLRRRGAVYYFRAKVPPELVAVFDGKREITYSLKTSDPAEANRLVKHHSIKFDQDCEAKRRQGEQPVAPKATESDIAVIVQAWESELLASDEQRRIEEGPRYHRKLDETLNIIEPDSRERLAQGHHPFIEQEMGYFFEGLPFSLPTDQAVYRKLAYEMSKAWVRTIEAKRKRQAGQIVDTPKAPVLALPQDAEVNRGGVQDLFNYWKLQEDRSAKTADSAATAINKFITLHGDLSAASVTKDHVISLRDAMVSRGNAPATVKKDLVDCNV
jgi:hypothetical protein